ncbi:RES family NAD+ phosphorylase [Vibrio vulnificus]|nr:RES family NAD+ phosphorylase [Vibrio vulnificus]
MDIMKDVDLLTEIGSHLRSKNRFSLTKEMSERINAYCEHCISDLAVLPEGTKLWRSRVMHLGQKAVYSKDEMGAPPSHVATAGRINPEGISYLYAALEENTAISEVRPWVGANISSGQLVSTTEIKLVDMRMKELDLSSVSGETPWAEQPNVTRQITKQLIDKMYFSAPIHSGDNLSYIASQFIAEKLKNLGADGILYPSVLNQSGLNVCLFEPALAQVVSVRLVQVEQVEYKVKLM